MKEAIHLGSRREVAPDKIERLESKGNYTLIHLTDGSDFLSSITLGTLQKRLSSFRFFRVNRSTLINLDYLGRFTIHSQSGILLETKKRNTQDIFLSRRREPAFIAYINA